MASLEELAQLIAIGQAQKEAIAASDPYLKVKQAPDLVSQLLLQSAANPQYSTKDKIIGGLLTGLASGALGNLSEDYQGRASDAYSDVLLQTLAADKKAPDINAILQGDDTIERPSVLSPSVFSDAKQQAKKFSIFRNLQQEDMAQAQSLKSAENIEKALMDRGMALDSNGRIVQLFNPIAEAASEVAAKKKAELEAESSFYGGDPSKNPNSPQYKVSKDTEDLGMNLRKEFQGQQAFKDFQIAEKGFRAMTKAISDPQSTSDLDLVYGAIQMIEPGMAVREGEQAAVRESGSIPQQWKGELENALNGKARLGDTVRQGILRLAERRYDEHARTFNTQYDFYSKEANRLGLKGGFSSMPMARPAEEVKQELLGGAQGLSLQEQARQILERRKSGMQGKTPTG